MHKNPNAGYRLTASYLEIYNEQVNNLHVVYNNVDKRQQNKPIVTIRVDYYEMIPYEFNATLSFDLG